MSNRPRPTWLPDRNTKLWVKIAWGVGLAFAFLIMLSAIVEIIRGPDEPKSDLPTQVLPVCEKADGTGQPICVTNNTRDGRTVVFMDFGSIAFFTDDNSFVYFKDKDGR